MQCSCACGVQLTLASLLDAVATFPCIIELLVRKQLPTLTYLRIFRLFRILKTERCCPP